MTQDPVGADRVVRTKTRHDEAFARHVEEQDEREKQIARRSTDAQETTSNQPSSSSSSNGTNRADNNVEHKQESNGGVHEQDAAMNNDDKEKQSRTEDKSHVTVSRHRETQDDGDRDSERQRLSCEATHQSKPRHAGVLKCWDHVNGGELSAPEVPKARRREVEYWNKMKVVERVPYSLIKHRTGKEPIKVR